MTSILHLETSTDLCSVALSDTKGTIYFREIKDRNAHAKQILLLISDVLEEASIKLSDLSAISVGRGPGSYTGLRIGISTAKGLCYALEKPLIDICPLQSMVAKAVERYPQKEAIYIPMTDAGRMEVYAGIYNRQGEVLRSVMADIVDENTYKDYAKDKQVVFMGNACEKCKQVLDPNTSTFLDDLVPSATHYHAMAHQKYKEKKFADLAYFEPFYLKEFIAVKAKIKGL